MAVGNDYVIVQKSQFDCLRQHCELCPYLDAQLRDSLDRCVVVIPSRGLPSEPSKKRKLLYGSGPQEVSQPSYSSWQTEAELPSQSLQQPKPQLPSQPSQQPKPQVLSQSSQPSEKKLPLQPSQQPQFPSRLNTSWGKKPKRPGIRRKDAAANWFLQNAPIATEWRKRQTELELNTTEQYKQIIRAFTDHTNVVFEREPCGGNRYSEHELINLAEKFALLTKNSFINTNLKRSLASFQLLILLSYCEVLRKRDVPYETIDPIIQHVTGRECDRKRLLDSAMWINGLIVDLVNHGWTIYRATELFFIDALSITYLMYIHDNEIQPIVQHLKRDEFMKYDYSDCLRPEFTIPGLIASLLDACNITADKPSINEICAALGYNSDCVPKSIESIYKVHRGSKGDPITSSGLDFEIMAPSSFQSDNRCLTPASNSYSRIRASDRRCLHTEGSSQPSMTVENVALDERATTTNFLSSTNRSVDDSDQDQERDLAANSLSHLIRDRASQQRPSLPTPPLSLEHTSPPSLAPDQNPFNLWAEAEIVLRSDCIEDTGYLLLLLHALGGSRIPELMLMRVQVPQSRWNDSGTEYSVTALEAGLDQQLLDILSDTDRFNQAIESFVESNTISGSRTFSLKSDLQFRISQFLSNQEKEKWTTKALKWICFTFPRDQLWEPQPSYASVVRSLLPLLNHALQAAEKRNVAAYREEVLEALLAACKVGSLQSRRSLLTMATHILENESPPYLRAEIVHQQSNISRLTGNFDHSERIIHDFCCGCENHSEKCIPQFYHQFEPNRLSKRLNALYGRLHGSHLENLVQCDKYIPAIQEVDDWRTSNSPSLMECRLLISRAITVAKVYRSQGLFMEVRLRLEGCLNTVLLHDTNRCQVLCSLADVYCDLRLPDKAHELIAREIGDEKKKTTKTKSLRRLLVTVVDTHIQRGLYGDALRTIEELGGTFNELSDLDVSDQLLHVRVLIASARICHYRSLFHQALREWEIALIHVQTYKSFEGEGFTYVVIYLSISLAHLECSNAREAWKAFKRAEMICSKRKRDFWIPTLAAWDKLIVSRIWSLTGWTFSIGQSLQRGN